MRVVMEMVAAKSRLRSFSDSFEDFLSSYSVGRRRMWVSQKCLGQNMISISHRATEPSLHNHREIPSATAAATAANSCSNGCKRQTASVIASSKQQFSVSFPKFRRMKNPPANLRLKKKKVNTTEPSRKKRKKLGIEAAILLVEEIARAVAKSTDVANAAHLSGRSGSSGRNKKGGVQGRKSGRKEVLEFQGMDREEQDEEQGRGSDEEGYAEAEDEEESECSAEEEEEETDGSSFE